MCSKFSGCQQAVWGFCRSLSFCYSPLPSDYCKHVEGGGFLFELFKSVVDTLQATDIYEDRAQLAKLN